MTTYAEWLAAGAADPRELVRIDDHGTHAVVRLDDPERLNPLSPGLMVQLRARLSELSARPELRAIVLTGEGTAFSAGGDLDMIEEGTRAIRDSAQPADTSDAWRWIRREFGGVARMIASTEKAFIAAVNGPAAGVGLAFALACDVILASERARVVPAFGRLGLVPEVGTSWLLTRRLGYQGAFAFFARGRHLTAQEALAIGLIQEVHADDELEAAALGWCERIAGLPEHVIAMAKPLLRNAADMSWEHALAMEEYAEAGCFSTATLGAAAAAVRASGAKGAAA
jgi:2-(1,2-epoxy-1,2-dihydrophenyl)acetyl-CoA isomerase